MSRTVHAAGTVCWRVVDNEIMVLLVHRTKQRDVSFPKGKLDKGESLPQTAVRETREETGLAVQLGVNLGTIHYQLSSGAEKTVQYWAAEVPESAVHTSTFRPNGEIAALEWAPLSQVAERLTYPADRELFEVFARLAARDAIDTFSIILLRHAKAEPIGELWSEDHLRPLSDAGDRQAETLTRILEPFGIKRIIASSAKRCVSTVEPFADYLGKRIRVREGLSQDTWESGDLSELRGIVGKVVRKRRNVVLCTHRPVLTDAAREIVLATGSIPGRYQEEAVALPTGGFAVFHLSRKHPGSGILAVESYPLKH